MSDQTDEQLFNEISSALKDGDSAKLTELTKEPVQSQEDDKNTEDDSTPVVEQPAESKSEEEKSPPNEADNKEDGDDKDDDQKEEPSELDKLKADLSKLREENHKLKSNAGRVPNIQHRLREMDKRLEELTKVKASPSSQPATKIKTRADEILKDVRDADPLLADAITNLIAEATNGVAEDALTREIESTQALRNAEAQSYLEEERNRLLERYPNAPEVFQSDFWSEWRDSQPAGIKALAESANADEVALALELYAKDMVARFPQLQQKQTPQPEASGKEPNEQAKTIEEGRKRRQQNVANVTNPNAPIKTEEEQDLQALFEKYSSEIRKARLGG